MRSVRLSSRGVNNDIVLENININGTALMDHGYLGDPSPSDIDTLKLYNVKAVDASFRYQPHKKISFSSCEFDGVIENLDPGTNPQITNSDAIEFMANDLTLNTYFSGNHTYTYLRNTDSFMNGWTVPQGIGRVQINNLQNRSIIICNGGNVFIMTGSSSARVEFFLKMNWITMSGNTIRNADATNTIQITNEPDGATIVGNTLVIDLGVVGAGYVSAIVNGVVANNYQTQKLNTI